MTPGDRDDLLGGDLVLMSFGVLGSQANRIPPVRFPAAGIA